MEREVELLWVDPQQIVRWTHEPPQEVLSDDGPHVLGGDWDQRGIPFEETRLFRAMHARFELRKEWEDTPYWDELERIESGIEAYGCRTEKEFREHLAYVDELHGWIAEYGYLTHAELCPPHGVRDEITVGIGRDGELIAFSHGHLGGRHRLAIARLLGLEQVPVRVLVRHEEWVRRHPDLAGRG